VAFSLGFNNFESHAVDKEKIVRFSVAGTHGELGALRRRELRAD
jgi:hypothetical protein